MIHTKNALRRNMRLGLLSAAVLLVAAWPTLSERLQQNRTYRDYTGLTPFRNVVVFGQEVTPTGLVIEGEMVKVRCEFAGLTAYVTFATGPRQRALVDTSIEEEFRPAGNRPPSPDAQAWGPWRIVWPPRLAPGRAYPPAAGWQVFADHRDCPFGPPTQSNLFASGHWSE